MAQAQGHSATGGNLENGRSSRVIDIRSSIKEGIVPKLELIYSHGASADIYKATFSSGQIVACKQNRVSGESAILDNEARVMQALSDRGLARIAPEYFGEQQDNGKTRIYMEYLDGYKDLSHLSEEEKLSPIEQVQVWKTVNSYLRDAQHNGITHLDFGASNVMIKRGRDGIDIKLIDWAMATSSAQDSDKIKGFRQFVSLLGKQLEDSALSVDDKKQLRNLESKE